MMDSLHVIAHRCARDVKDAIVRKQLHCVIGRDNRVRNLPEGLQYVWTNSSENEIASVIVAVLLDVAEQAANETRQKPAAVTPTAHPSD